MLELNVGRADLREIIHYYFDSTGKAFRPLVTILMARACNFHHGAKSFLLDGQYRLAMTTEMLHTASLIHDDVIDGSYRRRGKDSVNCVWGQRKAILAGDYILSVASSMLAKIGNSDVVSIVSQVVEDMVRGEFMQMGSKVSENDRFKHYLDKTFKKTASLFAASCQSVAILGGCSEAFSQLAYDYGKSLGIAFQVAILGGCSEAFSQLAYDYGKSLGIAFQLVDDLLDFVSNHQDMGKPTSTDLSLGLATAPVLFAAQQYPELNALIMRRFSAVGDVETARRCVIESNGIDRTKELASGYTDEALRLLQHMVPSDPQRGLISLTRSILDRRM